MKMLSDQGRDEDKIVLPHHEQQELCTSRLPYRQGRKLTAVKVYSIVNESSHLLIFGVPSLNLRHELKSLLSKFGRLKNLNVSTSHQSEAFTETYHAAYENIQTARMAKRMLDTKNFYGGSLHICYAPELETIDECKMKIFKRKTDVLNRLRNLQKNAKLESLETEKIDKIYESQTNKYELQTQKILVDMRVENTIKLNNRSLSLNSKKRKMQSKGKSIPEKICKPIYIDDLPSTSTSHIDLNTANDFKYDRKVYKNNKPYLKVIENSTKPIEVIDFTSTEKETLSNINEGLNYNKFGNEDIRIVPDKPINRIKFNFVHNKKN